MHIKVWTDGSSTGGRGPGGWAAIVAAMPPDMKYEHLAEVTLMGMAADTTRVILNDRDENDKLRCRVMLLRGREKDTTNNRMELTAIIEAVKALAPCKVTIYSDSEYAIGVLSGAKRAKANRDLIREWARLTAKGYDLEFTHVRGHSGHAMNELADRMAVAEKEKVND